MKPFFKILTLTLLVLTAAGCGGGAGDCKLSLGGLSCQSEPTPNSPPVASAGADQTGPLNTEFTLNASASLDANRDPLSYSWQMTSKPSGSQAALSSTSVPKPVFTADKVGIYEFTVEVSDGQSSTSASTRVTVEAANIAPQAIAGASQSVRVGDTVTLDGKDSSDANGDRLTYRWSLIPPAGSRATLDVPDLVRPQFKPDVPGIYMASLVVSDSKSTSATAVTRIDATAVTVNALPVARVSADQNVLLGNVVLLDGSTSSDADQDRLQYTWILTGKPPTSNLQTVDLPNSPITKFTPDVAGLYVFSLTVSDGKAENTTSTRVTAVLGNLAPVAVARTTTPSVQTGGTVVLDATASSDPNRDTIRYKWTVISAPVPSLNLTPNDASPLPTFVATAAGSYVFGLTVSDGSLNSTMTRVDVLATDRNAAPVASAGSDLFVNTGSSVTLNGTASRDANNDRLTYKWVMQYSPAGSTARLFGDTSDKPSFVADKSGLYVIGLVVNDGLLDSTMANVTVTASTTNLAPTADAGPPLTATLGSSVMLDGTASTDPQGRALTYSWYVIGPAQGSNLSTIPSPTSSRTAFVPDVAGVYVIGLTVSNGPTTSRPAVVTVTVN